MLIISDVITAAAALNEIYWNTPAPGNPNSISNHVNK
jgi:hypothetical protein